LASADKRDCEIPAIQPLETILVTFVPISSDKVLPLEVVPDTGANVTAIPESAVHGVALEPTKIILRGADGNTLKVKGVFEARVSLKGNETLETIYMVSGLSRPLLSRTTMKELGLIHQDFPLQDVAAVNPVQSSAKTNTERDTPEASTSVPIPVPPKST
jgi:predicted aspartyl protease